MLGPSLGGERVEAFVPHPLPPEPPLQLSGELREELDSALLALGRLDSVSTLLPDTALFLYVYIRKEAVLSSQIEGTQSSLHDLLLFEIDELPGVPFDDVREVSSYVRALEHGIARIGEGFPISNRLLREVHRILLEDGRGSDKHPGEFRTSQNWIGGTRPGNAVFVPPPPEHIAECMSALERFLHDQPTRTPPLLKAALAHVQFETIHPFPDGNGRLGRLLVTLLLVAEGVLQQPLLYLSLYLKTNRDSYYDLLQRVRTEGDWESWTHFFVRGVRETAEQAAGTARDLAALFRRERERLAELGRAANSALRVHEQLQRRPLLTIQAAAKLTGLSFPAVTDAFARLAESGIVREVTGKQRNRIYAHEPYLKRLEAGSAPLT